jgi:GT2 family glycosyltransferase
MNVPSVAIIIPTRGRPEPLRRCLRGLMPGVAGHPECAIVISDDGDAAQTQAALAAEFPGVRMVQGPRRGPAANRNCGAAHSSADLLVFLDDDCRPDANLVAEYQQAAAANPQCAVFEGRITADGNAAGFGDVAPVNETGGHLWSCNFAIRRPQFQSLGGFDERFPFPAVEDMDFHFRVAGRSPVQFVPGARVFHAFDRRAGWRFVKHHALSLLLYVHLHGVKETGMGPLHHIRVVAYLAAAGMLRILRRREARDPQHLFYILIANSGVAIITMFWRSHAALARLFFPACCRGCETIHASLAGIHATAAAGAAVNESRS